MKPKIEFLSTEVILQVLDEAHQLLRNPGILVQSMKARNILAEADGTIDKNSDRVRITEAMTDRVLKTAPREFTLYDLEGNPTIQFGGDHVHFDPGSCGVNILDSETSEHRSSITQDLINVVKITEMLPQYDAQSTAIICGDVPKTIGDLYRLYVLLLYSSKPIITGAFGKVNLETMIEMLSILAGGRASLAMKPRAVFDVCPSPPLIWSDFACENLITLAQNKIPAEMVSMPLAGAASPVTLLGSLVQHTAESLAGLVIHQHAKPGAPLVWGGAPAIFDMRKGSTPFGAAETAMIAAATAQVGKFLGLPTHTYLGASDSKVMDAQAGMESGMSALTGALAGINMISGAGMLDFLACQSLEKLVFDAEAIAWVKRIIRGIEIQTHPLALEMYENFQFKPDFLKQKTTRQLFKKEQYLPSKVVDRDSYRGWQEQGGMDSFTRSKIMVNDLLHTYQRPLLDVKMEKEVRTLVDNLAKKAGMKNDILWTTENEEF